MSKLDLYKDFYFKQTDIKYQLNNDINMPILILTAVVSLHVYFFSNETIDGLSKWFLIIPSTFNLVSIFFCVYFLAKSYSNLGKKFHYEEIKDLHHYFSAEQKAKELNQIEVFEKIFSERLTQAVNTNYTINSNRTEDLAEAKRMMFYSITLTLATTIIFIAFIIN